MKAFTICLLIFSVLTCKNTQDAMSSEKQNNISINGNYEINSVNGQKNSHDDLQITFNGDKTEWLFGPFIKNDLICIYVNPRAFRRCLAGGPGKPSVAIEWFPCHPFPKYPTPLRLKERRARTR